jgi:phosphatidylglycerol:prolipoprotein diacylglycerol transferase
MDTYVHHLSPYLVEFGGGWGIRWYGLAYLLAFLIGYWLYRWLAEAGYSDLRPQQVGDFIFGGALFGVVLGGRLGYMLFYNFQGFLADPLSFFRINEGGMSAHGGILGLALYSLYFARRHHVSWLNLGDNLVVVAPIGLFLGRMANFVNGELYGRPAQVPWAVRFPAELYEAPSRVTDAILERSTALNPDWDTVGEVVAMVPASEALRREVAEFLTPRHPSQIYEAALEGAVLFALLWWLRTCFRLPNGALTGCFFIGYAILRSTCEMFRQPDSAMVGVLTKGQFLSIFLVGFGACFLVAAWRGRDQAGSAKHG